MCSWVIGFLSDWQCVPLCLESVYLWKVTILSTLSLTHSQCVAWRHCTGLFPTPLHYPFLPFPSAALRLCLCAPSSDCPAYLHTCSLVYSTTISLTSTSISSPALHVFHSHFLKNIQFLFSVTIVKANLLAHTSSITSAGFVKLLVLMNLGGFYHDFVIHRLRRPTEMHLETFTVGTISLETLMINMHFNVPPGEPRGTKASMNINTLKQIGHALDNSWIRQQCSEDVKVCIEEDSQWDLVMDSQDGVWTMLL